MTLQAYYPLDEDSGSTAYDHSGNGNDATITGATLGATGLLGTTACSFDGTDDYVSTPIEVNPSGFTVSVWASPDSVNTESERVICEDTSGSAGSWVLFSRFQSSADDIWQFRVRDGTNGVWVDANGSTVTTGYIHLCAVFDGTSIELYEDGVLTGSNSLSGSMNTDSSTVAMGADSGGGTDFWAGDMDNVRVYDRALAPSEVQYLHDVSTTGTILTASKTHGSAISPDLRADVTLNSQAATAYVIGSPETASEEVKSVTLSTGSNDYSLTWNSTHTEFRIEVVADLTDVTTRVEVNRTALLA